MLTDEQILPVCYYWASRLSNKQFSFEELVNEAYVVAKKLDSPLLMHKWIKWTMIAMRNHRYQKQLNQIPKDVDAEDKSFNFLEFTEMQAELMSVINTVCNDKEKELLSMRFWHGMKLEEIAEGEDVKLYAISARLKVILKKLKRAYERMDKI